jgi:LPS O-antigen subunit length determinant protein (WzzB/FepE family)
MASCCPARIWMDSFMPVFSRRDFLRAAAALACAPFASPAWAEGIQLAQAKVVQKGDMFHLSGNFDVQLSQTLEDALNRGVQLTFIQSFEAEREREYWLAEGLTELSREVRVSYNALLRQYYVSVQGTSSTHESLADALRAAGDLRDWAVLNTQQMKRNSTYKINVRMYLDVSQLPKPLQVNALASSSRWQLDSGWQERSFTY